MSAPAPRPTPHPPPHPVPRPEPEPLPAWAAVALGERGQAEQPGRAHNPRIVAYHQACDLRATSDEVPWCSSFVNWVLQRCPLALRGTRSAAARSWLTWGRPLAAPRTWCIVVIRRRHGGAATVDRATGSPSGYHVGFWLAEDAGSITIFGGNQGDTVKTSVFSKRTYQVEDYRWTRTP